MARRLFFIPAIHHGHAELRGEEARHLSKVLRVERGQIYEISDNTQRYLAEVDAAHKELVSFRVLEKLDTPSDPCYLTLALALVKFDFWGSTSYGNRFLMFSSALGSLGMGWLFDVVRLGSVQSWNGSLVQSSQPPESPTPSL